MATTKKTPQVIESSIAKEIKGFKDVEFPSLYSNFMGVGANPFDISIVFAEVDQRGISTEAMPKMKVMMAPEQAANLIVMLSKTLQQYVATNGPLRNGGRMNLSDEG